MKANRNTIELLSRIPRNIEQKHLSIISLIIGNDIDITNSLGSESALQHVRGEGKLDEGTRVLITSLISLMKEYTDISNEDESKIISMTTQVLRSRYIMSLGLAPKLIKYGSITQENILPLLTATQLFSNDLIIGLTETTATDEDFSSTFAELVNVVKNSLSQ